VSCRDKLNNGFKWPAPLIDSTPKAGIHISLISIFHRDAALLSAKCHFGLAQTTK
jgi:hypothetical protein